MRKAFIEALKGYAVLTLTLLCLAPLMYFALVYFIPIMMGIVIIAALVANTGGKHGK